MAGVCVLANVDCGYVVKGTVLYCVIADELCLVGGRVGNNLFNDLLFSFRHDTVN